MKVKSLLKIPNPKVTGICFQMITIFFAFFLAQDACSFDIPEKLEYDLTWTGIKAGTSTLEIIDLGDSIKIISTAKSAKWVSVFYTVDDRIESTLKKNPQAQFVGQPYNYRVKLREGRHRRDKEVSFNHNTAKIIYRNHLTSEEKEFALTSGIMDPLSSFYYIRTQKLVVGKPVYVTVFDSKRVYDVEVQVLKKEKLELPSGTVDTILIKPILKSEGIFYRKGDIYIWLSDDEKRIPVKLKTKVPVGSIIATLVSGAY